MKDMDTVYQAIVDHGEDLGLGHVGTRVINTLRIEKGWLAGLIFFSFILIIIPGFRGWGHEMNKDTSPIEPGLMPFVKLNKKVKQNIKNNLS